LLLKTSKNEVFSTVSEVQFIAVRNSLFPRCQVFPFALKWTMLASLYSLILIFLFISLIISYSFIFYYILSLTT